MILGVFYPNFNSIQDFASKVKLYGSTINRYCVKQGQVGDCFFIATLSAIADHPEYIKQVTTLLYDLEKNT